MGVEIERKFLVKNESYKNIAIQAISIKQGYLTRNPDATVRIRIADDKAFITVKGRNNGIIRNEWEYDVPKHDAEEMLSICSGYVISKTRWIVVYQSNKWEIDEFHGKNDGLTIAEIEFEDPSATIDLPDFIGEEVTGMPQYYNSNL